MPQVQGSRCKLVYDQESTFGTTPGVPVAVLLPFKSESFAQDIELISSGVIRGTRSASKPANGNRSIKGAVATELAPYQAILFKHLLGGVTTTGAGPGYSHAIKIGGLPTSMCFEKQMPDITKFFLYNGVRINKASFDFKPSGFVETSYDFIGQKETVSGASFDASETDLGHNPFTGFQATILEAGGSIATITSMKLDIENNLQGDLYVIGGGGLVADVPSGKCKVSGSITAIFTATDLYDKAVAGTETSLKITLTQGTGAGTAGNEQIEFLLPEVRYKANTPTISDDKGLMIELPFEAYYENDASLSSITVTIKNTQATL